ncbi:glycosyltransferase family 1 protein [Bacillus sp. RO2]|uniref:glycosyltransferase family 1 protein n=1 Tax=Bacillus sp. RO2 TaxID=2723913 RepID=UPI00145C4057|nr:glycosyltransferase family 1 protein [Bacillus sp. RO2]NMH75287.1 glycosyltransferase family 1 protein [Bacillus sp. RO2]
MGSPIRVLHAVVNMNRGGAETLLMNLYRNIDRSKIQFDFLTSKEGVFDKEIQSLGGKVHRIPYITDIGHLGYTRALNRFFSSNLEYKIVHSHMDKMSGLVLKVAREHNVPTRIAHSHNTSSEGNSIAKLYKWYVGKDILKFATHYMACSDKAAKWLFKNNIHQAQILKNGIEPEKFKFSSSNRKRIREEFGIKESDFLIGHIGRFNEQKNHNFLLDVFSKISKVNKRAHLLLVGDGVLQEQLRKKVKRLKLEEKIVFAGVRSDIPDLLQGMDLFAFPSLHEGLPVTLIEAQSAGVPCLISEVITEEVDMGLGLVEYLPIKKHDQWVEAISAKMSISTDRVIDSSKTLDDKGYNIKNTASWTEGFYSAI